MHPAGCAPLGGPGAGLLCCAVPPPPRRLRPRRRDRFSSNLINSPQGDPLPPAARPGDARRGRGAGGAPGAGRRARSLPCHSHSAGTHRDGGCSARRIPARSPPRPAPHRSPRPPGSHNQGGPAPCSTLGLCPSSPRSCGSLGAVPSPDPSIMDIVAEPPGAGGWQRYYLHLSSFPAPPSFLGRRKSREIRRWKSRLQLLSCSLESGGISETSLPDPPPGGEPPNLRPCCAPAVLRGVLGHASAGVGRLKGLELLAAAGSKERPP